MSLIVQKFGGSSVADAEKLLHISHIAKEAYDAGNGVVVVVSAQGDATDRLIDKAKEISTSVSARELDALLSSGEQASAALAAMAIQSLGVPAVSLNAWLAAIHSDGVYGNAKIDRIERGRIDSELQNRRVVVVTGFQGVSDTLDVTTLGRGGSDYSAVALAAALGAAECRIYTDVDGVYTADPRVCPTARRLERVSYEDMYALARAGARVLHDKCVALAQEKGVEPRVLSCEAGSAGTLVGATGESRSVTGAACRADEGAPYAAVTLVGGGLPSLEMERAAILALNAAGIVVHGVEARERALSLRVARESADEALRAVHDAVV